MTVYKTGFRRPTTCTNVARQVRPDWTNPGNATRSDDIKATVALAAGEGSDYLQGVGFGFALPPEAVITRMTVRLEWYSSRADGEAWLFGVGVGTSLGSNIIAVPLSTTDQFTDHDMVDVSPLTPAIVNAAGFGVNFHVTNNSAGTATVYVDNFLIELEYTADALQAPVFIATGTQKEGTASIQPTWPGGGQTLAGDLGILLVESDANGADDLSVSSTWTRIIDPWPTSGTTTAGTKLYAYWKFAESDTPSDPIVADAGDHTFGVIATFRGCDSAAPTPFNAVASGQEPNTRYPNWPTITTTKDKCLLVQLIARANDSAAANYSVWLLEGRTVTERFDLGTALGNGGGLGIGTCVKETAGLQGTGSVDSVATTNHAMLHLALSPVLTGGGGPQGGGLFWGNNF